MHKLHAKEQNASSDVYGSKQNILITLFSVCTKKRKSSGSHSIFSSQQEFLNWANWGFSLF